MHDDDEDERAARSIAQVRPESCRRFPRCSASICPLDPAWRERQHVKGDRVCWFLLALAKPGGSAILRGSLPGKLAEAIAGAAPGIVSAIGDIRRRCTYAAKSGSRIGRRPGRGRARKAA